MVHDREILGYHEPPSSEGDDRRPAGHVEPCTGEQP